MTKKLFIKTYGCQMNVYDTERMQDVLAPEGYVSVEQPDDADLIILNTCHIREKAAEKVYSDIGRMRKFKDEHRAAGKTTFIAVAGCVGQAEGAEMMRRAPSVDMVIGPQTYHRLPELMKQAEKQRKHKNNARVLDTDFPVEAKFDHLPKVMKTKGPSAFLTVQEGCDKFCAFCVVPYTRGSEFSRPVEAIITDARTMVDNGVLEITLLGQNVSAFHGAGLAGGEETLAQLIRHLAEIDGLKRIRYTTSHPTEMDDDLFAVHRDIDACMPYLHLPIQSGADPVLKAMNRRHTVAQYLETVDRLRSARPDISLSSDFIVGFPGETDQDFEDTLELVRKVKYASAYSFKYSPRPGTPAAGNEDQVPEDVKVERLARLQDLINEQQQAFNETTVGRRLGVLLERPGKQEGQLIGRSPYLQSVHVDVTSLNKGVDEGGNGSYTDHIGKLMDVDIVEAGPNSVKGVIA